MKVSVIIPMYNSEATIDRALASVLAQDYADYELIVVDDGSVDRCVSIAQTYQAKFSGRMRYYYQERRGPAAARNEGIRRSSGEWVAFLDADDSWEPSKLSKQAALMEGNANLGLVYCDMAHIENGRTLYESYLHEQLDGGYSGIVYEKLLASNFIFTPTVLVRRSVLNDIGNFREDIRIGEDFDLWLRIARKHSIGFLDEALVNRYRHQENITRDRILYARSLIKVYESQSQYILSKPAGKIIKNKLKELHYALAYHSYKEKQYAEALRAFGKFLTKII